MTERLSQFGDNCDDNCDTHAIARARPWVRFLQPKVISRRFEPTGHNRFCLLRHQFWRRASSSCMAVALAPAPVFREIFFLHFGWGLVHVWWLGVGMEFISRFILGPNPTKKKEYPGTWFPGTRYRMWAIHMIIQGTQKPGYLSTRVGP